MSEMCSHVASIFRLPEMCASHFVQCLELLYHFGQSTSIISSYFSFNISNYMFSDLSIRLFCVVFMGGKRIMTDFINVLTSKRMTNVYKHILAFKCL